MKIVCLFYVLSSSINMENVKLINTFFSFLTFYNIYFLYLSLSSIFLICLLWYKCFLYALCLGLFVETFPFFPLDWNTLCFRKKFSHSIVHRFSPLKYSFSMELLGVPTKRIFFHSQTIDIYNNHFLCGINLVLRNVIFHMWICKIFIAETFLAWLGIFKVDSIFLKLGLFPCVVSKLTKMDTNKSFTWPFVIFLISILRDYLH